MSFSICFTGEPDQYLGDDPSVPFAMGRIVAGELDEGFASTLYEWSKRDYEVHWLQSLERLINGDTKIVLMTQYLDPAESLNLEWWALYRGEGDVVYVQNHLRFCDQLGKGFSVAEASKFLIWSELSIPLFCNVGFEVGLHGCLPFKGRAGSDRGSFCDG